MSAKRERLAGAPTFGRPLLLDTCSIEEIAGAPRQPVFAAVAGPAQQPTRWRRLKRMGLRSGMFVVASFTVAAIGLGAPGALHAMPSRNALIRLALLALALIALGAQVAPLFSRSLARFRKQHDERVKAYLQLGLVDVPAVADAAAALPRLHVAKRSLASRLGASWSWFALAAGVFAVLLAGMAALLVTLFVTAIKGNLVSIQGSVTFGVLLLSGMGLYGTGRLIWRSMEEPRLRRRKRALQRLLRAILNWLLTAGRRRVPWGLIPEPTVLGLCAAAALAAAGGFGHRLFADGSPPVSEASVEASVPGDERQPTPMATPTRTPTPKPGGAPAAPAGGTSESTPTPAESEAGSGGGGGNSSPAAGNASPAATATPRPTTGPGTPTVTPLPPTATPTRTPTPNATPTRTAAPTNTPTPTPVPPTATPVPPTATRTPTPTSTATRTPTPAPPTATPVPPTPTPTPSTPCAITGTDSDGDCWTNAQEGGYGSNPFSVNSTPEVWYDGLSATCHDGKDNDLDGTKDSPSEDPVNYDPGCLGIV